MNNWADGKVCRPEFPLRIRVEAPSLLHQEGRNFVRSTQHALDDHNDFSTHHLRLLLARSSESDTSSDPLMGDSNTQGPSFAAELNDQDVALTVKVLPGESGSSLCANLLAYSPTLEIHYGPSNVPSASSTSSSLATFVADELRKVFAEEESMLAYLMSSTPAKPNSQSQALSSDLAASLAKRTTRSFKYAPTYHLTFSLFTPGAAPSAWEIETALEEYVTPLLESLSSISNFTVDTQVQLYATFSPSIHEPEYDAGWDAWTLRKEDLSGFINAAEWPLSPSIGAGPTINFVLYVPSEAQTPLLIKENGGNSWLVPQWGGVYILNPAGVNRREPNSASVLTKDDIAPALLAFSNQLLSLLGLPQSPFSLPLRISTLARVRTASLIFSASSTLGSLARLTLALKSISIPNTVAKAVDETIMHLKRACEDLREGRFHSALESARVAEAEAEKAFFEPSMVGQVYFPDEHKVAVYLPLLGPVAVPLVMAALK
ncbi:GPI transamidase component, partial [Cryomyces antarcticus]